MAQIRLWTKVPDRSRLKVKVTGGAGTVEGTYGDSDGTHEPWSDAQLRKGIDRLLRTPKRYNATLLLKFATAGTLTVTAHVEKPDGTHHGEDFESPVTGQAGDVKVVVLGVVTLQS